MRLKTTFTPSKPLPGYFILETYFEGLKLKYYAEWNWDGFTIAISSRRKGWAKAEVEDFANRIVDYRHKQNN